jgi:uncharacterized membrane protein (DUF106 family)
MDNEQLLKEILVNQSVLTGITALLTSLIEEMHSKGLINANGVMEQFNKNIKEAKNEMEKLERELENGKR